MINKKFADALNEQIKHELESAYIYLSAAAWFHSLNLDGMAHWMRCQTHEETIHAMKFFDHLIARGEKGTLLDLKQLKTQWQSPQEVWKDAYEHEQFVTGKIKDLMIICREVMDFSAEPMLNWFINEQIEEEENTSRIYGQLKLIGGEKQGLLMIDRELAARVFTAGSPFDPIAYQVAI